MYWLIMNYGSPSMCHASYSTKELCEAELNRLLNIDIETNNRITNLPATGKGSCFLNVRPRNTWSIKEVK